LRRAGGVIPRSGVIKTCYFGKFHDAPDNAFAFQIFVKIICHIFNHMQFCRYSGFDGVIINEFTINFYLKGYGIFLFK
jgi:hypothetical protein